MYLLNSKYRYLDNLTFDRIIIYIDNVKVINLEKIHTYVLHPTILTFVLAENVYRIAPKISNLFCLKKANFNSFFSIFF